MPTALLLGIAGALMTPGVGTGADRQGILGITVSRPFFDPALGQKIGISFALAQSGNLTVLILDRDGYPVRKLIAGEAVEKGKHALDWDGKDEQGEVVPDEAYSLRIELDHGGKAAIYFPANTGEEDLKAVTNYYGRQSGVLSYKLPKPARVHIQAGTAVVDPRTGKATGPVLRTLVNREPRPAGAVIENWNGFDQSGLFYVPDLPNFVIAVAATALPDNALITIGNRGSSFVDRALGRRGESLLTAKAEDHHHHHGLSTIEDVSPSLHLEPRNASWNSAERTWTARGDALTLALRLEGATASRFRQEPGGVTVFIDGQIAKDLRDLKGLLSPSGDLTVDVPLARLAAGSHLLAVNWGTDFGPVSVGALRVRKGAPSLAGPSGRPPH
jgi:hypothetical protein